MMDAMPDDSSPLLLGPLLRFVGEHKATIWVETTHAARVEVHIGERSWSAPSFVVEEHHYALVLVTERDTRKRDALEVRPQALEPQRHLPRPHRCRPAAGDGWHAAHRVPGAR